MAIDLRNETLISLAEASARLPGRPSLTTIWRWRLRGVRGRRLESVIIGGRPFTSIEALERFAQHQGGTADTIRTPSARENSIRKAERELAARGA